MADDPSTTDAPAPKRPSRRAVTLVTVPLVALVIASYVGDGLAPTLVDSHPAWLIALNARSRNLVLVTNYLDPWTYYGIGIVRLLISDPLFFLLGHWYGDAAVRWMERRTKYLGPDAAPGRGLVRQGRVPHRLPRPQQLHLPVRRRRGHAAAGVLPRQPGRDGVPAVAGAALRRGVRGARSTTSSTGSATTAASSSPSAWAWCCCRSRSRPSGARPRCRRSPISTTRSRTSRTSSTVATMPTAAGRRRAAPGSRDGRSSGGEGRRPGRLPSATPRPKP